ncbi:MAG: hypothetical protein HY763_06310 [Planctomycetes bacterium]|nr:hypothetical protein [Planctomycetota bacterium]
MKVLTAADFVLASCQATAFTPDGDFSVTRAMTEFYPAFKSLFDGDPTVLPPVPEGAPPDFPRVILESSAHEWRCELAPARANVFWRRTQTAGAGVELAAFFHKAAEVLQSYTRAVGARVGRLAALTTRFAAHEAPALFLARHFCQDRWDQAPLNRPENFELHAHKSFALTGEFRVNSWARSKTGKMSSDAEHKPIVLFEQDLNTVIEETAARTFTMEEVRRYFRAVGAELDAILKLYFPVE